LSCREVRGLQWAEDAIDVMKEVSAYVGKVTGGSLRKGQVVVNEDVCPCQTRVRGCGWQVVGVTGSHSVLLWQYVVTGWYGVGGGFESVRGCDVISGQGLICEVRDSLSAAQKMGGELVQPIGRASGNATRGWSEAGVGKANPRSGMCRGARWMR